MKAHFGIFVMLTLLMLPIEGHAAAPTPSNQTGNKTGELKAQTAEVQTPEAAVIDPKPAEAAVPESPITDMQFPVMRTIGGMGMVVCLMIGAFFLAKKYAPGYFNKAVSARNMKIVETLGMGDRRSISLVEVGNSRFLIGNTPHQINLLATLSESVSLVSEPDPLPETSKPSLKKQSKMPFRNLFEVEKNRSTQYAGHPLPDDLRAKMRQLRDALERT